MAPILAFLFAIPLVASPAGPPMPAIGTIDYYGLHRVQKTAVERSLQITLGEEVTKSLRSAKTRLEAVPGVARARLNFVCCDASGKTILYVGIKEAGTPQLRFRRAPDGKIRLPADITAAGQAYDEALMKAVEAGNAGEDDSPGYSLSDNPGLRAIEERYVAFATHNLPILREVLHHSSDADQRALAAGVMGYAPDHRSVVPDLEYAISDPNSDVRNNAMRALAIIARYALAHPSRNIKIPARPFIALLNSLAWSDRDKAGFALMALTENRNPALLTVLRRQALPQLIEMARWKTAGHADIFCAILGRIEGLPEKKIWSELQHGEKEKIIAAAVKEEPVKGASAEVGPRR